MMADDDLVEIKIRLAEARRFVTDAKGVSRHVSDIGDKTERAGRQMDAANRRSRAAAAGFRAFSTAAKIGAVALVVGLGVGLKTSISNFAEAEVVMADQAAALKSTGAAAWITGRQLQTMADIQSMRTGADDEAIASAQTLLLTFTKVRNAVGKNNDIFNQANSVVGDFSVRFKKDLSGSAILVGKALNDPIKGVSALSKVGVQFDAGQKKTIKTLVESGRTMAAQKIILKELRVQTKGAADAYGKTLRGSMDRAKVVIGNVAEWFGGKLAPSVKGAVDWVTKFGVIMSTSMGKGASPMSALTTAIGRMFGWQSKTLSVWLKIRGAMPKVWKLLQSGANTVRGFIPHIMAFGKSILDGLKPAMPFITNIIVPLFKGLAVGIIGSIVSAWKVVWPVFKLLMRVLGSIGTFAAPFRGHIEKIGFVLGFVFSGPLLKAVSGLGKLGAVLGFVGRIFSGFGRLVGGAIGMARRGLAALFPAVRGAMALVVGLLKKTGGTLVRVGAGLWEGLVRGLKGAFGSGLGFVKDMAKQFANAIIKLLNVAIPNTIPVPGAPNINLPNNPIPMLAAGGTVSGVGSWITGEAGPELNTSDGRGRVRVQPLTRSAPDDFNPLAFLGGGGRPGGDDGTMELHVYIDGTEVNARLGRTVRRAKGRK
jgi:hypothetical protein